MRPEELQRIKAVFVEVLASSQDDREVILAREFIDAPELHVDVSRLLKSYDQLDSFLETPIIERLWGTSTEPFGITHLGRYELLSRRGRGGMATVYEARSISDVFERRVAVKVLHRFSHSQRDLERLRMEVQNLLRLSHPNIVQFIDSEIMSESVAFIVTEFIDGKHLNDHCEDLPLRERLRLFVQVCEAVWHAHSKGIIHRDIKPSNILVKADGTPKLLDFGISVWLGPDEKLTRTELHGMTLPYASPGQICGDQDVSTITDIYSLGIILREIANEKSRDIEAIVRKATQKNRDERYLSVELLKRDVENFLGGKPVLARGDDFPYFASKYLERYWRWAVAFGGVLVLLVALAITSIVQARAAILQAITARLHAVEVKTLLLKAFGDARAVPEGWVNLRQIRTVEMTRLDYLNLLSSEFKDDPVVQVQHFHSFDDLGTVLGLPDALNLGYTALAFKNFQSAVQSGERLLDGREPILSASEVAAAHIKLGNVLLEMGHRGDAEAQFSRAYELVQVENGSPAVRATLEVLAQKSRILVLLGQEKEALDLRREIVRRCKVLFDKDPVAMEWEYAGRLCSYGWLLREMGYLSEAEKVYTEALPMFEDLAKDNPNNLETQRQLAQQSGEFGKVLLTEHKYALAATHLDRAIEQYRMVMRREPNAISIQRALAVTLSIRGAMLLKVRQRHRGHKMVQEALQLSEEAVKQDPASAKAKAELVAIRQRLTGDKQ